MNQTNSNPADDLLRNSYRERPIMQESTFINAYYQPISNTTFIPNNNIPMQQQVPQTFAPFVYNSSSNILPPIQNQTPIYPVNLNSIPEYSQVESTALYSREVESSIGTHHPNLYSTTINPPIRQQHYSSIQIPPHTAKKRMDPPLSKPLIPESPTTALANSLSTAAKNNPMIAILSAQILANTNETSYSPSDALKEILNKKEEEETADEEDEEDETSTPSYEKSPTNSKSGKKRKTSEMSKSSDSNSSNSNSSTDSVKRCSNCLTSVTPLWRKSPEGKYLCNRCGLFYLRHKKHKPISSLENQRNLQISPQIEESPTKKLKKNSDTNNEPNIDIDPTQDRTSSSPTLVNLLQQNQQVPSISLTFNTDDKESAESSKKLVLDPSMATKLFQALRDCKVKIT